jgi:putative tricarboxylic transport membrane protein
MRAGRLWTALPYAVIFVIAAWFYRLAGEIEYTRRGDFPGPDFWPRMALGAMMIICAVQFARLMIFGRSEAEDAGVIDMSGADEDEAPRSSVLLLSGIALTIAYGAAMPILGFLISTFLFLALFMVVGRYRAPIPVLVTSLTGALVTLILFQKVVYVSLPRGVPPFDGVADMILRLF